MKKLTQRDIDEAKDLIGLRIDLLEVIDSEKAWRCFGHDWIRKDRYKKGDQVSHLYFGKEGYCSWNYHINIVSERYFYEAFKKIGTFIIKSVNLK